MVGRSLRSFTWDATKVHLRIDPSGVGVLVVGAERAVYLNKTATYFAEALLSGKDPRQVGKEALKKFRGVTSEQVLKDYEDVSSKLRAFLDGQEACPITDLGFERMDPLSLKLSAPFRADLALTYECNNRCVHCYSSSPRRSVRELSTDQWKAAMDKLAIIGVPNLVFTGGEPTLREDLVELVRETQEHGLVVGLVTNGRKLSDMTYAKALVDAGLDYAQVTLESHLPEVHEKITAVEGSWRETVDGIRNLVELDLYLDVNATLSKLNVEHIREYVDFVADLGVEAVSANRLIYSGRGVEVREWFEPSFEEYDEALELMTSAAYEHDMTFRWYGVTRYCDHNPLLKDLGLKFCSACSITIAIEPNGDVIPCQSYYHPLGNILKDRWDRIWNHELCKKIRSRAFVATSCMDCPLFSACGGGCPLEVSVHPYQEPPATFPTGTERG